MPVATFLLIAAGATTPDKLAEKRPYIVIGAFVFGMLLTPPDVISQSLLALPMWFLFEIGLIMSRIFLKDKIAEKNASDDDNKAGDYEIIEEGPDLESDEDMEKAFDEMEQEEEENIRRPE